MSVPTNVTNPSISAVSGSIRNATSTAIAFAPNQVGLSPIGSHDQSVATIGASPCVSPHQAKIASIAVTNERPQAIGPTTEWSAANGM